ncbi:WapI family immunity protein [Gottfriedia acidiceleris]|uniref:WapI family immunity protein n=1 Tax=Gottfriedia acidiceleris TaxID=371036 RepID=UPI002FFF38E4
MYAFELGGKQGNIRIELTDVLGFPKETSYLGGYDVKGKIEIKSGNYYVKDAELWFSTGQLYEFYQQLHKCYEKIEGIINFPNPDSSELKLVLEFIGLGQFTIQGSFQENLTEENFLEFEFESEQSYLTSTLAELKEIVDYYGGNKGLII